MRDSNGPLGKLISRLENGKLINSWASQMAFPWILWLWGITQYYVLIIASGNIQFFDVKCSVLWTAFVSVHCFSVTMRVYSWELLLTVPQADEKVVFSCFLLLLILWNFLFTSAQTQCLFQLMLRHNLISFFLWIELQPSKPEIGNTQTDSSAIHTTVSS